MTFRIGHLLCLLLCLALAACGNLPRGAAVEQEILTSADDAEADFAVYPVTRAFLPILAQWPRNDPRRHGWIGRSRGSNAQIIRPGDSLNLRIWDSSENSLLTAPAERVATMDGVRVSENGTIYVPYIGRLNIAGRTPDAARSLVQRRLESIVPAAQVQLSMSEGRGNSIDLVGGVNVPGNVILPDNDFTVLAAISSGGGVRDSLQNPQVKLVRGNRIFRTSIRNLYDDPGLDTRLQGGDKVIVEADDRYFLSLGATGLEAQIRFNRDDLSALDALALTGGVDENRANPESVLILREYPPSAVRPGVRGPRQTRVVFTIDLTTSDGLFSARNFPIQHGDLVLGTESPASAARTLIGLVGSGFLLINRVNG